MIQPINPALAPATLPDGETLYEIVDGEIRELPPMSAYEINVASKLAGRMRVYGEDQNHGRAVTEMLFNLFPEESPQRRPDIAFVTYRLWPGSVPETEAWQVVPELMIEVVSKSNTTEEVLKKIHEYFRAGVQRVWVIYPKFAEVYVYSSPHDVKILGQKDGLDGEHIIPGFRYPLAKLFE